MPAYDQTGPVGQGPLTGRGMGSCGNGMGVGGGRRGMGLRRGAGFGGCRGYGRGLGRYFGWNTPQTNDEKIADIEAYKKALQEEMEDLEKELEDLKK